VTRGGEKGDIALKRENAANSRTQPATEHDEEAKSCLEGASLLIPLIEIGITLALIPPLRSSAYRIGLSADPFGGNGTIPGSSPVPPRKPRRSIGPTRMNQ
jgi:hypothetical protein